ncbi:MAG: hypothetical protein HC804_06305 [Anaerolineae bacterium]|nr:hypothetical protein [Anaerolineae bacterium]
MYNQAADGDYLFELQKLLATHYNLQELRTLALRLTVDLEDVGGETRAEKARELTLLLARQNRLPELLLALQQERPLVAWPPLPHNVNLPTPPEQPSTRGLLKRPWLIGALGIGLLVGLAALGFIYGRASQTTWHDISGGTAILGLPTDAMHHRGATLSNSAHRTA